MRYRAGGVGGHTAGMKLRDMTLDDAERVHAWRNRPEIADVMFTNDPIPWDDHVAWMERLPADPTSRYWIVEHDDRPVGVASLNDISERHQRCSWAYYIGEPDTPGPVGLAVEFEVMAIVFADMGFHRLISEVLASNDRVVALHERVGFVREGLLREHVRRSDGVHDVVVLSMLAEEWQARHAKRRRT